MLKNLNDAMGGYQDRSFSCGSATLSRAVRLGYSGAVVGQGEVLIAFVPNSKQQKSSMSIGTNSLEWQLAELTVHPHCEQGRTIIAMPLFTISMRAGRSADEKDSISVAIHEASKKAGYPSDDFFQRFFCLEQADLRVDLHYPGLPQPRSENMLMIEVLVSSGTDADRRNRLLAALVEALHAAGTDPNDIMVFFGEIDRASSSFGGGRLAPPVVRT